VAKDSIEISFADKFPKARIIKPPKPLGICAFVGDFDPGVAIQKGNIPLNFCAKFGVNSLFSTAQPAVDSAYIELRMLRHSVQERRHVLHGVATDIKHPVATIRHGVHPLSGSRCRGLSRSIEPEKSSSQKLYMGRPGVSLWAVPGGNPSLSCNHSRRDARAGSERLASLH